VLRVERQDQVHIGERDVTHLQPAVKCSLWTPDAITDTKMIEAETRSRTKQYACLLGDDRHDLVRNLPLSRGPDLDAAATVGRKRLAEGGPAGEAQSKGEPPNEREESLDDCYLADSDFTFS
jgi:hypothetical protein